jgi:hypothetical protein
MRDIFPVKFYSDEGFVGYKVEINDEDLEEIIGEYLSRHAKFDFDEIEVVNNRPMNVWPMPSAKSTWTRTPPRRSRGSRPVVSAPRSRSEASTTAIRREGESWAWDINWTKSNADWCSPV